MTMPKDYLPRKGDILVIHAKTIYNVRHDAEYIFVAVNGHDFGIQPSDIVDLHRPYLEIGDSVRDEVNVICTIIGIHEDSVWLIDRNGHCHTANAHELLVYSAEEVPSE
jgi:hypothetical protein